MSLSHVSNLLDQNLPINLESKKLILECESILTQTNEQIHEGQISFTHGYVPFKPLMDEFPVAFKAWNDLAANLPQYIAEACEREKIQALPILDASNVETLPDQYLARASAILGNTAHAYYFNKRLGFNQTVDPLPDCIRLPWEQVNARVGRKLPHYEPGKLKAIRGSYDAFLCNWQTSKPELLDGVRNAQMTLDDLSIHMPMFQNNEERVFVLTIVLMELRFAPALKPMINAVKAVAKKDNAALLQALKEVTSVVESISAALDMLTANQHSKNYVDPTVWSKTIATFDGEIPGGLPGLSASVFPLFHTLDSFIERKKFDSILGKAFVEKYNAQPQHVFNFIEALRSDLRRFSISAYIEASQDPLLKNQYQVLMDVYLGHAGLTNIHAAKAYGYLKINFRSGRLETNGRQRGTATIETEEQRKTIENFSNADLERKRNHIPKPFYATKIKVASLNGNTSEVVLDVSQTGLTFLPGDHCAVLPTNTEAEVNHVLSEFKLHDDLTVALNNEWKQFFFSQLGLDIEVINIKELIKYVSNIQNLDLTNVNIQALHPLSPRLYSVSPMVNALGNIRLTVGRHFYEDAQKQQLEGKASGYLVNTTSAIHIDRTPARHFYLPTNPATPILMFAAGTGISPFMGFIEARRNQNVQGLNWLFFSTQNHASLHYQEELKSAVAQDNLKLSVIFSREDANTLEMNEVTGDFEYKKKYDGKHIDALIKANGQAIYELIQNGAHIYVCGNNGFAKTVRDTLEATLKAYKTSWSEAQCEKYIDELIANHAYHYDAFTPSERSVSSKQIYRSEVAYHNRQNDCWMIIDGSVYDLSRFMHVHPGGRKILHINAGLDATEDYVHIRHHLNPQIEALLLQTKVGALAEVNFNDKKINAIYKKLIQFLESLLEMGNTLSNSTTFLSEHPPLYLWREVLNILVYGHLNNYQSEDNMGPLKYSFKNLLSQLNTLLGVPLDRYEPELTVFFKLAGECSEIIRTSTLGATTETISSIEKINTMISQKILAFIESVKLAVIRFAQKLESSTESHAVDQTELAKLVDEISKNITELLPTLTKARNLLTGFESKSSQHPFFSAPPTAGVCPFGFGKQKAPTSSAVVTTSQYAYNTLFNGVINRSTATNSALIAGSLLVFSVAGLDTTVALSVTLGMLRKLFTANSTTQNQPTVTRNSI